MSQRDKQKLKNCIHQWGYIMTKDLNDKYCSMCHRYWYEVQEEEISQRDKQDYIEIKEEFKKAGDRIDREMFYKSGDEWISLRKDIDFPVVFYDPPGKKMQYVNKFSWRSPQELNQMKLLTGPTKQK